MRDREEQVQEKQVIYNVFSESFNSHPPCFAVSPETWRCDGICGIYMGIHSP